ncbi:MAG TPA: hypothetical protein VIV37_08535 [Gaiellaceae bacterium]
MREDEARTRVLSADCVLDPGSDERALGGAVTVALCGHWEHEGDCCWPHLTVTEAGREGLVHVRTTVTVAEDDEDEVRRRFHAALATGALTGPDGAVSSWRLVEA